MSLHCGMDVVSGVTAANPTWERTPRMIPADITSYCNGRAVYRVVQGKREPDALFLLLLLLSPMMKDGWLAWKRYLARRTHPVFLSITIRRRMVGENTHPMIRAHIVDLLIPAGSPDIFADELDDVQSVSEHWSIFAQSELFLNENKLGTRRDTNTDLSEKLAPTCIPIDSSRCRTCSSSSSAVLFPEVLAGRETILAVESLALSFLTAGGIGVGGINPASAISCSIFFWRAVATAADSNICSINPNWCGGGTYQRAIPLKADKMGAARSNHLSVGKILVVARVLGTFSEQDRVRTLLGLFDAEAQRAISRLRFTFCRVMLHYSIWQKSRLSKWFLPVSFQALVFQKQGDKDGTQKSIKANTKTTWLCNGDVFDRVASLFRLLSSQPFTEPLDFVVVVAVDFSFFSSPNYVLFFPFVSFPFKDTLTTLHNGLRSVDGYWWWG